MPAELLLYTARAEHDVLGHAIGFFEKGTFTHSALYRLGQTVEAVWPKVRLLDGQASEQARAGASAAVPLMPWSESRDVVVWAALLGHVVGQPYSLSTLVADALGNWIGHQTVVRLGGSVVCSALAGQYARLVGDPRIPIWTDTDSLTPADLGQLFVGRRVHREAA
jgi:hypothetical protein